MEDQVLGSECSSGCESGWTLYLEHSFLSPYPPPSPGGNAHFLDQRDGAFNKGNTEDDDEEEEEDLSMVSDASSGPPHFQEYEDHHYNSNGGGSGIYYPQPVIPIDYTLFKGKNQQKIKENRRRKPQDLPSFLDDTASSPFFNFSNNNLTLSNNHASMEDMVDFSQGYSTTHFEGKSTFQEHFGFYHSPVSGSQLQQNQWFEEKRMGMR